jgi:hypothetical protein
VLILLPIVALAGILINVVFHIVHGYLGTVVPLVLLLLSVPAGWFAVGVATWQLWRNPAMRTPGNISYLLWGAPAIVITVIVITFCVSGFLHARM